MFIPYEIDASFDHRPVVNWLVILGIVLIFVLQVVTSEKQAAEEPRETESQIDRVLRVQTAEKKVAEEQVEKKRAVTGPMARFALNGWGFGLFTYIWLQGGVIRLIGNLIFLWPFGNAVCAKLGNKRYLLIFLGFALLAGLVHLLLGTGQAVGVGAVICGIIGIYIVLFPEDMMSCFVILPRPMAVSISGAWFVLLWFIFDIFASAGLRGQSTTYGAHVLCVGAGAGLAILMLKKKWLVMEMDEKSLLQMLAKKKEEQEEGKEGQEKDEKQEKKDLEAVEKQPETIAKEKAVPHPVVSSDSRLAQAVPKHTAETKRPENDFIRFKCECGHRIKVHKRDAGKAGRCPKCSRWVEAPRG